MSYGGVPSWIYKNRMNSQAASYESQVRRLELKIEELEKENI